MAVITPSVWRHLRRHLRDAQRHIPLYRNLWGVPAHNFADQPTADALQQLPLLTRAHLREAGLAGRLDPRFRRKRLRPLATSGSSGEPLQLLLDRRTLWRRQWRFLRALLACGYRPGMKVMLISSRSSRSVKKVSGLASSLRWHYVDLYDGDKQMLAAFERLRPHVLYGPHNALLALMAAADAARASHSPDILVSTSEPLTGISRDRLQAHFGVDVTDFYGMTELGLLAWRAAGASSYDWAADDVHLEFLPAEHAIDRMHLVVTDLRGGSMPFYRYVTGDLVRMQDGRVVEFEGKQLDSLFLPDGRRLAPYLFDEALSTVHGLVRYRIVQHPDLSIEASIEAQSHAAAADAREALCAVVEGCVPVRVVATDFSSEPLTHKMRPIVSLARPVA